MEAGRQNSYARTKQTLTIFQTDDLVGCTPSTAETIVHANPGITPEASATSHRRSLVKISSLARSNWFHSSRSFSCPFQLSLSCSLVLKAGGGQEESHRATNHAEGSQATNILQISEPLVKASLLESQETVISLYCHSFFICIAYILINPDHNILLLHMNIV